MTDTSVIDLDANLIGHGRRNLNILNGKVLGGLPRDCGLASNGLGKGQLRFLLAQSPRQAARTFPAVDMLCDCWEYWIVTSDSTREEQKLEGL